MPKMKQLGYSIYELSKMQNSWTVRELMLFPKQTAAHLRAESKRNDRCRVGEVKLNQQPPHSFGPLADVL
jgi:hypothetical protein